MKSWLGAMQVLAAGTCFGFLGVFGKLAFASGLSVGELLTLRFSFAAVILGILLILARPAWLRIGTRQTLISLLLGVCGYAVFSTLYFESIRGISVGLAALLLFTFPIFVSLGSFLFFRERLSARQIVSLFLASIGLVGLVWGDWAVEKTTALVCGLAAAITYAAYVLVSGRVQKNVRPLSSSFYVIIGAALALAVFHRPSLAHLSQLAPRQFLLILGIAVLSTIAPLTLFLAGLQKMSSSKASVLVMIEPVVATAAGALIFDETLTPPQGAGAALILTALVLQSWKARPAEGLS